jgi:hypothetical protein
MFTDLVTLRAEGDDGLFSAFVTAKGTFGACEFQSHMIAFLCDVQDAIDPQYGVYVDQLMEMLDAPEYDHAVLHHALSELAFHEEPAMFAAYAEWVASVGTERQIVRGA